MPTDPTPPAPELFKVLGPTAEAIHGGAGQWHKPHGKRPGKWMEAIADPKCCRRGYHLVETYALPRWLRSDCTIWLAEGRGASHTDGSGKTAYSQARLTRRLHLSERTLRLFAVDCAEHVLPIWTANYPDDDRPAKAIEAARRFALGEISEDAARATANAAAYAANDAAAYAANAAAYAAYAAANAAANAAAYAAYAAANAAANAAAYAAYAANAANATAYAAYAAYAANAAANAAAYAAYAAANADEHQWQAETLRAYLSEDTHD